MIIETCPKCGCPLQEFVIATYPPIPRKECLACGWSWEGEPQEIVYRPFGGNGGTIQMNESLKKNYNIETILMCRDGYIEPIESKNNFPNSLDNR